MIFEELNEAACKTYLVASEETQEAMLVDPVLEKVEDYLNEIEKRALTLRYIVDTHVHADHISGAPAIRDRTGVDYIMHRTSPSACANLRFDEGDTLMLGDIPVHFLHTPGHTQDSLTLRLPDRILSGDFLFIGEGGAGRTDLPGGDPGEHWDALQKLKDLPDDLLVFPAHDYHGRKHSTLGQERKTNPRLERRTRGDYIGWLTGLKLGPAEWMADVIRANYACAMDPSAAWIPADQPTCEVSGTAGSVNAELVRTIPPQEVHRLVKADQPPFVLDVRERSEYDGEFGHIKGAHLVPVGALPAQLAELDAFKLKPVVTVCRSGGRSATAAAILTVAGFKDVHSMDGGMQRWRALRFPVEKRVV